MELWDRVLDREIRKAVRVAVVGVGNLARGDDAAGTLVARTLLARLGSSPGKALVIAAEEAPENYTGLIRAFSPDLSLLVDCAAAGHAPWTVLFLHPTPISDEDVSTHRVPLSRLAHYIRETMLCRVLILGIEPFSFKEGGGLSPAVGRAVRKIVDVLRQALEPK
jgi:hydrogenase 3 maturation protease